MNDLEMRMRYFESLHPGCIFLYFVCMIGLSLVCFHPVMGLISCMGAVLLLIMIRGWRQAAGWLMFAGTLLLFVAVANPLMSHRGASMIVKVFHQWITWEAVGYGITSGLSLASLILWFACYSVVMTEDKFLYLFGQVAPGSALLITTALQMIPKLKRQLTQIRISQQLLGTKPKTLQEKFSAGLRHLSTLIGWSMEDAVEQADSMRARGYGIRRRTTFHLFVFDSRDLRFLMGLLILALILCAGRMAGYGSMEFYPRMDPVVQGTGSFIFFVMYLILALLPGILEMKEAVRWRSYKWMR